MIENNGIIGRFIAAVLCFIYAIFFIQSSPKTSANRYCGYGEFFFGLWSVCDIIQAYSKTPGSIFFIQTIIYILTEFTSCSLLASMIKLTGKLNIDNPPKIERLFLFPIITIILSFFLKLLFNQYIFFKETEILSPNLYPGYNLPKRLYYAFHFTICFVCIAWSGLYPVLKGIKIFKSNKFNYTIISIIGISFLIFTTYKVILESRNPSYNTSDSFIPDTTVYLSRILFSTVIFFMLYFNSAQKNMRLCYEQLFSSSLFPIFIFTENNELVTLNKSALALLNEYYVRINDYEKFDKIFSEEKFQKLGKTNSKEQDEEFYLSSVTDKKLFYCRIQKLKTRYEKSAGYFLILSKMDIYSSIINRLSYSSTTDELTGLKKRNEFEKCFIEHQNSLSTPIIIGCLKINNLERLNELIGLKKTDLYIKTFANIIKNSMIQQDIKEELLFRMDGSIFAFILQLKYQDNIRDLFDNIKKECSNFSKTRVHPLNCSLGYSITKMQDSSPAKAFQRSFENMLLDKNKV